MKKITILVVIAMLLNFGTAWASAQTTVDVPYLVSSVKRYDCEDDVFAGQMGFPVRFKLPDNHGKVGMRLVTGYAYALTGSYSDALTGFVQPPIYSGRKAIMDALTSGMDALVSGINYEEGVYQVDDFGAIVAAIAGQVLAVYHVRFLDGSGNELERFTLPIGEIDIDMSEQVQFVEVCSIISVSDSQYKKSQFDGTVTFENLHELEEG